VFLLVRLHPPCEGDLYWFDAASPHSLLIQHDHIAAGHPEYVSFLHGRNDPDAEALGGQGGLDDMGVISSRFVQNFQVVVDEDASFVFFLVGRGVLEIPPVRIDERQPGLFFDVVFHFGKKRFQKRQVIVSGQAENAVFIILPRFFVKVGRIKQDQIGFSLCRHRPGQSLIRSGFPCEGFDFRAGIGPVLHVKGPAPAAHGKAGVRGHAAPGHGVQDQAPRLGSMPFLG